MRTPIWFLLALGAGCESTNPGRIASDAPFDAAGPDAEADADPGCTADDVCDDADPCTVDDRCQRGTCRGEPRDCVDDDPCTSDACDLATGACSHRPSSGLPEGPPGDPTCTDAVDQDCDGRLDAADNDCRACEDAADCPQDNPCATATCEAGRCTERAGDEGQSCDTGSPCDEKGSCREGRCEASERLCPGPVAEDPCMVGLCIPASGECGHGRAPDGTACDDGDPCTSSDACEVGICGGAPTQCDALSTACVVGLCDPATGGCEVTTVPDGTPCDNDDEVCQLDGQCAGGRCEVRGRDCSNLDGACRVGVCDAASGGCAAFAVEDGEVCDDGDPCTFQDACTGGGCRGLTLDCGVLDTDCQIGRCDAATGACVSESVPNGTGCDDLAACTEGDSCQDGRCTGLPLRCDDPAAPCRAATCDEAAGGCVEGPSVDGAVCDDESRCTTGDVCVAGACAAAPVECPPPSACFAGTCDPANGACTFQRVLGANPEGEPGGATCQDAADNDCDGLVDAGDPDCRVCAADADCAAADPCANFTCAAGRCVTDRAARDGAACDDQSACTEGDVCRAGLCVATPRSCADLDTECTAGRCDLLAGGCVVEPRPEGAACDDRDPCTRGDACVGGLCGGAPLECAALDGECVVGACAPETGECVSTPRGDGAPCTDADACTSADLCLGDRCVGQAAACEAGPCEIGECDPGTGACHVRPAADGDACDDGDPCTEADTCGSGACAGRVADCSALDGPCVAGVCDPQLGCRAVPLPDLSPCDDGSLCTADETCLGGLCLGTEPDCDALDGACRDGLCDPSTGRCEAVPAGEGETCDDADACSANDVCRDGSCRGEAVDCSALTSLCGSGRCDPASGACEVDAVNEGARCDDGNACTAGDVCDAGRCAGVGQDCSALSGPCSVGGCGPDGACESNPLADGTPCVTDDLCLEGGTCRAGACQGQPRDCSALDSACTTGVCDPRNGACAAEPVPDQTGCDDDSVCTERDACIGGRCEGFARNCGFLDGPCTQGDCDPELPDGCFARPIVDGAACTSGNPCQVGEACRAGRCEGTPRLCPAPAAGSCQVAACDPGNGVCGFAAAPNGSSCDDGRYCNSGETCTNGQCGGGAARDCNPPGEPCKSGSCDENGDRCVVQDRANDLACEDGQYCTTDERCNGGICRPRRQRNCPDANAGCRVGVCNEGADRCDLRDAIDLKPCLDGDGCTLGDHCDDGACVSGFRICN